MLFLSTLSHNDPSEALSRPAHGQLWRAMVRAPLTSGGAKLTVASAADGAASAGAPSMELRVEGVITPWIEQGEPDGVEAALRISSGVVPAGATHPAGAPTRKSSESHLATDAPPLAALLSSLGQTPLPPYLQRAATPEDVQSYQTVYAADHQVGRLQPCPTKQYAAVATSTSPLDRHHRITPPSHHPTIASPHHSITPP